MSTVSANEPDDPENGDSSSSDAMNDQLRGDVTSWMAARSEATARKSTELSVSAAKPPATKPATRAKQAKPVTTSVQTVDGKKKPFGMSYDGMSQADYITYMISRGAR